MAEQTNIGVAYLKMHGIGNEFVILDARAEPGISAFAAAAARRIADPATGPGCDQLLILETSEKADAFMRIYNADGSESGACGNGARCVASLLMDECGRDNITLATIGGLLPSVRAGAGVQVDMGSPRFAWNEVPLAREAEIGCLVADTRAARALSMGNPHAVFFVAEAEAVDVPSLGAAVETHTLFPERANASFASVLADGSIRLRVWERGAGETKACGSAACAAAVAGSVLGLTERKVTVHLDGGDLEIEWDARDHVLMRGPVAHMSGGTLDG